MSQEAFREYASEPDLVDQFVSMLGTGASVPTKLFGRCTITRSGAGVLTLTWPSFQGRYLGLKGFGFEATAPAALKGYSLVVGDWNATTRAIVLNVTDSTNTLADLAAAQRLSLTLAFKRTNT